MSNLNKLGVRSLVAFSAIGIVHFYATNLLRPRFSSFFIFVLLSLVTLITSSFVFPQITYAVHVTLAWDANSEPNLDGYKSFYRQEGDNYNYNHPDWVGSHTETTCTIYGLYDNTIYYFVVRAFDTSGNESSDSNEVCNLPTLPPTADAGPNQTVNGGVTVALNGSHSTDPDGSIASYMWTQTNGIPVTLSDPRAPQPTFIAPSVGVESEALTFQLTVTDDGGLSDTDNVIINVSNVNQAPTADAGLDQTVDADDTVTLDGSNSFDPDDWISSYLWTQTNGMPVTLSDPGAPQPTFIAPSVGTSSEKVLNFELAVTDGEGLCDTDSVIITIYHLSSDPVQTIFDLRCVFESSSIWLKWSPVAEATCYNVYRSLTSGGPYSMIADCHVTNMCSYLDTNVVNHTTYYYVVTSVAQGVESLYSNEGCRVVTCSPCHRATVE